MCIEPPFPRLTPVWRPVSSEITPRAVAPSRQVQEWQRYAVMRESFSLITECMPTATASCPGIGQRKIALAFLGCSKKFKKAGNPIPIYFIWKGTATNFFGDSSWLGICTFRHSQNPCKFSQLFLTYFKCQLYLRKNFFFSFSIKNYMFISIPYAFLK